MQVFERSTINWWGEGHHAINYYSEDQRSLWDQVPFSALYNPFSNRFSFSPHRQPRPQDQAQQGPRPDQGGED